LSGTWTPPRRNGRLVLVVSCPLRCAEPTVANGSLDPAPLRQESWGERSLPPLYPQPVNDDDHRPVMVDCVRCECLSAHFDVAADRFSKVTPIRWRAGGELDLREMYVRVCKFPAVVDADRLAELQDIGALLVVSVCERRCGQTAFEQYCCISVRSVYASRRRLIAHNLGKGNAWRTNRKERENE